MKKFKIEYLLYIFIIITPILDAVSFLFRKHFPNVGFSPATIIRPIIPIILLLYVFITDKSKRKFLILSSLIYLIYGSIHLIIYKNNLVISSSGTIFSELQYLVNYTYMIYILFLYLYFNKKGTLKYLNRCIYISLGVYLSIIFISILTNTSSTTYIEGIGYKGWFLQGNSLCTTLLLMMCALLPDIFKTPKWYKFLLLILLGIYLLFLIGTRTGMLGYILVLAIFIIIWIFDYFSKLKKINYKVLGISLGIICVMGVALSVFGSETLERRKHIDNANNDIIDVNTLEAGHTTGDTSIIVKKIYDNTMEENYMSDAAKKAYVDMYLYANKKNFAATDKRRQQIVYHTYLIKEQKNFLMLLFGNGYLSSNGEMVLEMELLALLYNFGIIGFILFFGPFVVVVFKNVKKIGKEKKINIDKIMYLVAFLLATGLSLVAGYVYFSASCVLMLICNLTLLEGEKS